MLILVFNDFDVQTEFLQLCDSLKINPPITQNPELDVTNVSQSNVEAFDNENAVTESSTETDGATNNSFDEENNSVHSFCHYRYN